MDIGKMVYAFFNDPGPGGVVVLLVLVGGLIFYIYLRGWIVAGGKPRG